VIPDFDEIQALFNDGAEDPSAFFWACSFGRVKMVQIPPCATPMAKAVSITLAPLTAFGLKELKFGMEWSVNSNPL